jgi:hypothetical protein
MSLARFLLGAGAGGAVVTASQQPGGLQEVLAKLGVTPATSGDEALRRQIEQLQNALVRSFDRQSTVVIERDGGSRRAG